MWQGYFSNFKSVSFGLREMVIIKKKNLHSQGVGGLRRAEHLENDLTWTRDKWPDSFHRRSTADVAGMKGSRRPRGRRFLPREHISLNSLVEIGPPDGILCISPTRHSILLLPAVLPSVTAIMGRVINIWSPSLKCRRCNVVTASKWSFYDLIISDSNTMLISFF